MNLFIFAQSSSSRRVRIALSLKALDFTTTVLNPEKAGNSHFDDDFRLVNPQALVPLLEDNGHYFHQSLAILEYLEEQYPDPPLLPSTAEGRAKVRGLALEIACEVHPISSLKTLAALKSRLGTDDQKALAWSRHFLDKGLGEIEVRLNSWHSAGDFCYGTRPTLADCFLIPQVFNAIRFGCDVGAHRRVSAVYEACMALPAFRDAFV